MDDGYGGHVEGQADSKGVGGEGSGYDQHGLNAVVEEKVGNKVVEDYPELLDLPGGVSELAEGEGDSGEEVESAGGLVGRGFRDGEKGPEGPGEPPDADGSDGGAGGEVFVVGVLGDEDDDQVDDEEDAAAGVSVGKASAADIVPEASRGDVGEEGVVEDEAAGKADVGQDECSQEPRPGMASVC